jgi:hypothetical protein
MGTNLGILPDSCLEAKYKGIQRFITTVTVKILIRKLPVWQHPFKGFFAVL